MPHVVYSPRYDIGFFGLERLHPFDSRKYGRAWKRLAQGLGSRAGDVLLRTDRSATRQELLAVHSAAYLDRLGDRAYLADILELPIVRRLPAWLTDWRVLRPMRWAVRGSVLAARAALDNGFAVNLSGGYHHAKPDAGEGFCVYNDIALVVHTLRAEGRIAAGECVMYVDLDAHQGNGVCHEFMEDRRLVIFDMFNAAVYPSDDVAARGRIDFAVPLAPGCDDRQYLGLLESQLPACLDSFGRRSVRLAIYNAGTDVYAGDALGGLALTADAVCRRDRFVVDAMRDRGIPTVMLLSGGYSAESYRLVADSVLGLFGGQ
jgi:histone deacetylase 11